MNARIRSWWWLHHERILLCIGRADLQSRVRRFPPGHDTEKTQANGGRARNLPTGGQYSNYQTWGEVLHALWQDAGTSPSVKVGSATIAVTVQ